MKLTKKQLDIVQYPEAILNSTNNSKIEDFGSDWLYALIVNMVYTIQRVKGLGLAAPQVGLPLRIAVALIDRQPVALINPEIVEKSDEQVTIEESCLSCPNEAVRISRSSRVKVAYYNVKGQEKTLEVAGINAIVVQHEINHLNGKLIVNYKDAKPAPELLQDPS